MNKLFILVLVLATLIGCKKKDKNADAYDTYDYKTKPYDVIIIDTTLKKGDSLLTLNTTYISPGIDPKLTKSRWEHISGSIYKVKVPGDAVVYMGDGDGPLRLMNGRMYCKIAFNATGPNGDTLDNFVARW